MKIIDRYILGIFFTIFAGSLAVLLTLFIAITFFDIVDDFVTYHATSSQVVSYFLLKIPEAIKHMTPMAVLIASILTFSLLSRNREVIIMMSCGLSAFRIAIPVLLAATAISSLSFLNSEFLAPPSWKKSRHIFRYDIKKLPRPSAMRRDKVWLKTDSGDIWNIDFLELATGTLHGLTVTQFNPERSGFRKIITAKKAEYEQNGKWLLKRGNITTFSDNGHLEEKAFDEMSFNANLDIDELKQVEKMEQEMSLKEIKAYIKKIRKAGYDDTRYRVDMYVKGTFPLVSLIMAIIAIPFSLKTSRPSGILAGIVTAIALGFLFWFCFSMGVSLGRSGMLPPLLATTAAHLLFLFAALYKMTAQYQMKSGLFAKS